ncbi:hypothetical protein [Haloactinomyces albus]|uniref:hypothetical protein n=1 Tax=Haloactinomyces albus TaxID=1352928 RepID=UPI00286AD207|nr:hypothetical protein [Haloactinomyces albus]
MSFINVPVGLLVLLGSRTLIAAERHRGQLGTLGALLSALAAFRFSAVAVEVSYWLHLAPAMFLLALGFGLGVMALTQAAVYRVDPDNTDLPTGTALVTGYSTAMTVAAGVLVTAGVLALTMLSAQPSTKPEPHDTATDEPAESTT